MRSDLVYTGNSTAKYICKIYGKNYIDNDD